MYYCSRLKTVAHVAELVDAADSKSAIRKGVKVRFLSWAPFKSLQILRGFLFRNKHAVSKSMYQLLPFFQIKALAIF